VGETDNLMIGNLTVVVSKSKVVPYSIMSIELGVDPGFLAVSLHVT